MSTKIIAEIGINHNGSIDITKKLIDVAVAAGCDMVKFQKRTPDICVPEAQKSKEKSTPWGKMTYLEYKHKIEFGKTEYDQIDRYCSERNIDWFASVWDEESVNFMSQYTDLQKIPSALITNIELIRVSRDRADKLMLSTGMSSEDQIEEAVKYGSPDILFHTNSTYPSPVHEIHLRYITWLIEKYPEIEIGYSGHEFGLVPTFAAVTLGAKYIERHVTLDRTMWGSDQMASVEPGGLIKLVKGIRDLEKAIGEKGPRIITDGELIKLKSLRG